MSTVYISHHIGSACGDKSQNGRHSMAHYRVASTPDGATYAVATDGRIAAITPCDAPDGPVSDPVLVPREASARYGVRINIDNGQIISRSMTATGKFSNTPAKVYSMPSDDRPFPPLDHVMNDDSTRHWVTLDANLLHRLAAAIGDGTVSLGFRLGGDGYISRDRPIYVVGHDATEDITSVHGIGALMPKSNEYLTHSSLNDAYQKAIAEAMPVLG